jgi:endonuclease YncB( thermonuclease family)
MPNRLGTKVRIANTVSALVIAVIMVAAAPAARAQQSIVGVASVVDGDTIEVHGARIRMHGIDAPESRQEKAYPVVPGFAGAGLVAAA